MISSQTFPFYDESNDFERTTIGQCMNYALATSHVEEDQYLVTILVVDVKKIQDELSKFFILKELKSDRLQITYKMDLNEVDYIISAKLVDELADLGMITIDCQYSF